MWCPRARERLDHFTKTLSIDHVFGWYRYEKEVKMTRSKVYGDKNDDRTIDPASLILLPLKGTEGDHIV